jgi:L-iditol 2-dehydrogenase
MDEKIGTSPMNDKSTKMMKAAFLTGRMQIEVRNIPVPEVPRGGALLKVDSTGLCGSDINRIRYTTSDEQRVIGHEVAGEIVEVDTGVTLFNPGDRVAVAHVHIPCGHCVYCRHGTPAMCRQFKESKIIPGGYAQYIALSPDHLAHTVIRIPEAVSYAEATFVDPVACCFRALQTSGVQAFDRVVVVGAGIMGQIFVQLLRNLKAETTIIDISDYRLEKAKSYGANYALNSNDSGLSDKVLSQTDGIGADVVIMTFLTQDLLDKAMTYVRDGGKFCMFAPPLKDLELKMNFYDLFRRELSMFGSYSFMLTDMETTMKYISTKTVDVQSMITQHTDLDHLLASVAALDEKQLKVIVNP